MGWLEGAAMYLATRLKRENPRLVGIEIQKGLLHVSTFDTHNIININ